MFTVVDHGLHPDLDLFCGSFDKTVSMLCNAMQEAIGLLWVWPESGPTASLEAATKSLNIPPGWDTDPEQWLPLKHWFMRDVPYSWDTLIENVVSRSFPHCQVPF